MRFLANQQTVAAQAQQAVYFAEIFTVFLLLHLPLVSTVRVSVSSWAGWKLRLRLQQHLDLLHTSSISFLPETNVKPEQTPSTQTLGSRERCRRLQPWVSGRRDNKNNRGSFTDTCGQLRAVRATGQEFKIFNCKPCFTAGGGDLGVLVDFVWDV